MSELFQLSAREAVDRLHTKELSPSDLLDTEARIAQCEPQRGTTTCLRPMHANERTSCRAQSQRTNPTTDELHSCTLH
jgi:hypothetical protein